MTKGVEEVYSQLNKMYNDIIFRINENESKPHLKKLNDEFLEALEETRDLFNKNDFQGAKKSCSKLRAHSKPLLKVEWERVKAGEPAYQNAKYFSVVILVVGALLFSYTSYKTIDSVLVNQTQQKS
ncbi:hypothetical protein MBH78_01495 [Oceanimonas sp. NS1]|nr:hypothetical protein [Oceanimonas sp. NS1]